MSKLAIVYGLALVAIGVGGYLGTGRSSVTALIPAFGGAPILICGVLALKHSRRKHAMHVAVLLSLALAVGAGMRFFPSVFRGKMGTPVVLQGIVVVLSLAFLVLAIRSFIVARLPRKGNDSPK